MAKWIPEGFYVDVAVDLRCGEGCRVWSFAVIGSGVVMGDRCVIGSGCYIGRNSVFGDDVHLNHGCFLPNGSRLGHRVFLGPHVTCTDDKYPRVNNPSYEALPPIIDDDVSIGAGAVLLPGVHLYQGCMIAAGAVVTHDVPMGETWAGMPAKRHRRLPDLPADSGWLYRLSTKGHV